MRNQRGFTLIELLVVAAALSMLALLLLPDLASLQNDFKANMAVHDIQMLKSALLRFHADMGVWPAVNAPPPDDGIADVNLMGGSCGGSGAVENFTTNDPGLLCAGASGGSVAIGPASTNGAFNTATATVGTIKMWRGPYINREVKSNPYGGSYVLSFENLSNVPGVQFGGMPSTAQAVVLQMTRVPGEAQLRIDSKLDDGNLLTGFVQGDGESLLKVIVAQF